MKSFRKRIISTAVATMITISSVCTGVGVVSAETPEIQVQESIKGFENQKAKLNLSKVTDYVSGMTNADGGVMEIVDYNEKTQWAYAINGQAGCLTAISMEDMKVGSSLKGNDIDIKALIETEDFTYGDMTSVSVSPDGSSLAVAIQAEDYTADGRVAVFNCKEDGTLELKYSSKTGVQPDMVTYTPDGSKLITANEGEPRLGYGDGIVDPMGTVTVVNAETGESKNADFTVFDSEEVRKSLADKGVVIKKDTAPSVDFEPEYVATTDKTAYVSLQEANAIAVLDLEDVVIKAVYPVGFEDYSKYAVDIDKKDEKYSPKTYESLRGVRMPDGITLATIDGIDYLITANEGDSREWGTDTDGEYLNEDERNFGKGKTSPTGKITPENSGITGKVVFLDISDYDGLDSEKDYIFGGRTFTMFKITEDGLEEVFTSGDDFERLTAQYIPEHFNCSNDDISIDDRSGKKGPEPESVVVGVIDNKTYAFVGLERIGGVMVYDITDTTNVSYVNYINSRDYSADIMGDDSPEGLHFVPATGSPNGKNLLFVACEVSGTVAVYDVSVANEVEDTSTTTEPTTATTTTPTTVTETTTEPSSETTVTETKIEPTTVTTEPTTATTAPQPTTKPAVKVTSVKINYTSKVLNRGSKFTLKATVSPSNATNKTVKWTTTNSKIATVTQTGIVTAKAKGTAYIRATANDGSKKYAQCKVTVKQPVTAVKLNATAKTLNRGSKTTLKATVYPSSASVRTVSWKSLNTRVATVTSKGVVTAKSKGATYVRATALDGSRKYAQCKITVKQPVTAVKLNATSMSLKEGSKFTLKATVYPTNANVKTVTWKSTNTKVATVTSTGGVTAKTRGTAYVRATAKDGSKKYAQCVIYIKK